MRMASLPRQMGNRPGLSIVLAAAAGLALGWAWRRYGQSRFGPHRIGPGRGWDLQDRVAQGRGRQVPQRMGQPSGPPPERLIGERLAGKSAAGSAQVFEQPGMGAQGRSLRDQINQEPDNLASGRI